MSKNIIIHAEYVLHITKHIPNTLLPLGWSDALGVDTLHCVRTMLYNFVQDFKTVSNSLITANKLKCVYFGNTGVPTTRTLNGYIKKTTETLLQCVDDINTL